MADLKSRVEEILNKAPLSISQTRRAGSNGLRNAGEIADLIIRELAEREAKLVEALDVAIGCFNAAYAEGLHDKLMEIDNPEPGSLVDLVQRRLLPALEKAQTTLKALEVE